MKRILLSGLLFGGLFLQGNIVNAHRNQEALIQSLRAASNDTIGKHDVEALARFWTQDMILVRGNSTRLIGKDTIVQAWRRLFKENPEVSYIRTPVEIRVSSNDSLAWETGTWKAVHSYSQGGNYSAMWKKIGDSWKISAELFVSMF